jgi:hypothetical protein
MRLGQNKVSSLGENHTMNIIHGNYGNMVLVRLYINIIQGIYIYMIACLLQDPVSPGLKCFKDMRDW